MLKATQSFKFIKLNRTNIALLLKEATQKYRKLIIEQKFSSFYVDLAIGLQWSEERRNQHFKAFLQSVQATMTYEKPNLAGRQPGNLGNQKRRVRLPEPELFEERIIEEEPNE